MRDSYDLLSHMATKKDWLFLQYNKQRVIDPEAESESQSSSDQSSSDEEKDKGLP